MTMTKTENSERGAAIVPPISWYPDPRALGMVTQPIAQMLSLQSNLLQMGEKMASYWFQRQREAMAATVKLFGKLAESRDADGVATVQREWLDQQMRFLGSDVQVISEEVIALSQIGLLATRGAAESENKKAQPVPETAAAKSPTDKAA
jgi:hypothetical protein